LTDVSLNNSNGLQKEAKVASTPDLSNWSNKVFLKERSTDRWPCCRRRKAIWSHYCNVMICSDGIFTWQQGWGWMEKTNPLQEKMEEFVVIID
jgi:hypothetical protein